MGRHHGGWQLHFEQRSVQTCWSRDLCKHAGAFQGALVISKMWSKGGPGAWMLPMLFIRASFELYHSLPSTATAAAYCYDLRSNAKACSILDTSLSSFSSQLFLFSTTIGQWASYSGNCPVKRARIMARGGGSAGAGSGTATARKRAPTSPRARCPPTPLIIHM